jgi:hypothetical protein
MQTYRLLLEKPVYEELEFIVEEKNTKEPSHYFLQGPYLMYDKPNKNKRQYAANEMISEVLRYTNEFISRNRALGELNHPKESTEVDLERACHMVVSLEQRDNNYFWGKSKILSTPSGVVVRQLLSDGCKLGISSRALGRLNPRGDVNLVEGFRLLALDLVHEPSVNDAMLDSIMENRQYIIQEGGRIVELACDSLECKLNSIPKKQVESYLAESLANFFKSLKG